ncbi:MAG: CehA/McbA family metallohydrolase, partial [Rhizobiaceae bacterium]
DGVLEPEAVVQAYRAAGYDFMALTDHFMEVFDWPVADTRGMRGNDFTTIIGAELHAPDNSAGEIWHVLAVGLPLDFAPLGEGETGVDVAERAKASGAFVAIAHPSWSQLTIEDGRAMACAHAVEIYNHGCAIENDRGEGFYLLDQLLNEGRRLSACATDDAHFKTPDHFGGWVHVKAESLDPEVLTEALKAGAYYSSQGPLIHDIRIEGSQIVIETSPVDTITVVCGHSRTLIRNGRAITDAAFDLRALDAKRPAGRESAWVRVTVIDNSGKRAWSNPVYWREG